MPDRYSSGIPARCENLEVFTISETKTKSSRRLLCLPAYVADALRKRWELLEERRRELGAAYNEQNLVCFWETGVPFTSNALRHQYLKALEQAGLPAIRFHDLRHTFANAMLGANVPEKVVSAVLGHSGFLSWKYCQNPESWIPRKPNFRG